MTRGKQLLIAGVLLVGFASIFVRPASEERAARAAFERLVATLADKPGEAPVAREARLRRELASLVDSDVHVTLPGGESLQGRDAFITKALELGRGRRPVISLQEVRTGRPGRGLVRVAFEVLVSDSQAGDLHAAPRAGEAEMAKSDQGFRLHWLEVGDEARAEPEPRP
ncbi:MAG: hypothetical protein HS104_29120 [Polyangiaceae bacterium]|nr:hypothetical protein [Polyangiaceae bacterium]MCE7893107.1 hypothetical protein [Sorangiineae bacterium PRO1]MCL4755981.1 hypothetical protein [Myxococcales bacterium]